MPIPTCEITKICFTSDGDGAPRVLPCRHVYSLTGIRKIIDESEGAEGACPRCGSPISPGILNRLPRHKKLCTLVKLLTTYQTGPVHVQAVETPENTVDHDGGHPVYAGTLHKAGVVRPVHVKVIPLSDAQKASRAWRELVMMLQVTQALGRSVVRTLGYVEQPGVSLKIILEADDGSVLRLRNGGRLDCEFGMRLAERVASALGCLHATNVLHGSICPAALRVAPPADTAADTARTVPTSTTLPHASQSAIVHTDEGVRVMLGELSDACAVGPPTYTVPTAHATAGLAPSAAHFAAPERVDRVAGVLRAQSDMYAFAATMHHLLTGLPPRDSDDAAGAAATAPAAAAANSKPSLNRRLSAGLERMKSLTSGGPRGAAAAATGADAAGAEAESGAPEEFFALLRECLDARAERRPGAEEVARRLAFILSDGDFKDGKFVSRRPKAQAKHPEPAAKTHRGLGATVRTLMHMGSAESAATTDTGAKRGFRFSSLRDKLVAMVCVAKGADSATVAVTRVHALGEDEAALEAYTMSVPGGTPSAASSAGLTQHAAAAGERHQFQAPPAQRPAPDTVDSTAFFSSESGSVATSETLGPKPPTRKAVRGLSPPRDGRYAHENLKAWVSQVSSDAAAAAVEARPAPTSRPKHPLALDEQASVVLTKLGFPRLAVDMAVSESAGNLEDSLQILLAPQDEVLVRCHRSIAREFAKLSAAAQARAAERPGAPRSVVTADLWDWVEEQAGATLDADDVNGVLQRSAGAADDEDVSLPQFTHVVVRMFEQFFRVLDKQGCGYLTQEELREAFFDSSTEDVTSKLRGAMDEIDLNGDGGVSLNELLLVGLGRSPSLHSSFMGTRALSSHAHDTIAEEESESDSCTRAAAGAHTAKNGGAAASGAGASASPSEDGGEAQREQLEDMTEDLTDRLTRGVPLTESEEDSAGGRRGETPWEGEGAASFSEGSSMPAWPPRLPDGTPVLGGKAHSSADTV